MKPSSSNEYVAEYIGSVHGETIKRIFMQEDKESVDIKQKKSKMFPHKK
jgi:hypothetical protein